MMAEDDDIDGYLDRLDEATASEITRIETEVATHPKLAKALERPIRSAKLREGLYYSTISDLWVDKQTEAIDGSMATAFQRSKRPEGYDSIDIVDGRSEVGRHIVAKTKDTSLTSKARKRIYPNDIFKHKGNGNIAHLTPNSPDCAEYFEDVGDWVLALKPLEETKGTRSSRRLSSTNEDLEAKRRKMAVNGYKKSRKTSRVQNSALKQHILNHIRLQSQGTYLDAYPCVIIVPLVDMQFLRDWNGEEFEAMVVVGGSTYGDEEKLAHEVCQAIGMTRQLPCCSAGELQDATQLISWALHALANSMVRKERAHFDRARTYRKELLGTYDKLKDSNLISVPVHNEDLEGLNIAKIKFGKFGNEEEVHLAVDPTLLLMKAAVVLSTRFGERLLPACPPQVNDWDSAREAMAQAYLTLERSRWVAPKVVQTAANCDDVGSLSD